MPHDKQHYYEVKQYKDEDLWKFQIYHYDASGNQQIIVHKSGFYFYSKEEAEDAACEWAEDHDIDAEMS